jgi:RNA polymerase sigma factor (sigma-70 family)
LLSEEGQLLSQYVDTQSQEAFGQLVDRYVNLVHAAARRQVGDGDLARDVTQAVFLVLAEKAAELKHDRPLSAWLLQVTRYASANAVRARLRRARHEQRAAQMATTTTATTTTIGDDSNSEWQRLSPLLDEGMGRLRAKDRDVLLLRFFEQKTAREVADAMGISEDAAEKRIARAVAKLRDFFQRRGVAVSLIALAATLAAHSAEAAPIGLTTTIASSAASSLAPAAAGAASAGSIAKGTVIAMASAKAKTIVVAAVVGLLLVGTGTIAVKTWQSPGARRQIDVSRTLAADAAAADAAAKASPWAATFADGTMVELLGVTAKPGAPRGWWAADGSRVGAPQPLPRSILRATAPGHTVYQFALRQSSRGAADSSVLVNFSAATPSSASGSTAIPGGGQMLNIMAAVPADVQNIDLGLSVSQGPWQLDWRYDLNDPRNPAAATTTASATQPASMTIGNVTDGSAAGKTTKIEMRRKGSYPGDREVQLRVVTIGGKEVGASSMSSSMFGPDVYEFNAPRKDVVAVVSRSRALESGTIRNVLLRPTTQPTAGATPTAAR